MPAITSKFPHFQNIYQTLQRYDFFVTTSLENLIKVYIFIIFHPQMFATDRIL